MAAALSGVLRAAEPSVAVEKRLSEAAQYLSSDQMEGRGIGTKGLELAAEYIATQFAGVGLKTDLFEKSPFQPLEVATGTKLGEENRLSLVGPPPQQGGEPDRIDLKLGQQFTPMAMGGSGRFDLPLVFVGYGITGSEEGYDDYAGLDVKEKAVVILRHEPQQADPKSVFNGTSVSQHAPFLRKVTNAFDHGAAAVIFCTDQFEIRRNVRQAHARWQAAVGKLAGQHARFKQVVESYQVNRKVSDFPEGEDFSTPEAAYATVNRGIASGWRRADWVRASSADLRSRVSRAPEEKHVEVPPAEAKAHTGALVKEVRTFRGKQGGVIAEKPGADDKPPRYNLRCFVLEGDRWLNEGEGDHESLEAARAMFGQTCSIHAALTIDEIESQRKRIEELAGEVEKLGQSLQKAYDPLLSFTSGGRGSPPQDFPVVFCRRAPLDRVFKASLQTDLAALEQQIDEGPTPHSHVLGGWKAVGEVEVDRTEVEVKNVIAVLEGEGPLAEETLVIGAHYDHLGFGRGSGKAVYNGADDNASGVAVMLEVARRLASRPEKLRRRVVFIAFAAEERGLLGSRHYVRNPRFPIEDTIAMLNLDCVGRLREDKLNVGGAGSAAGFGPLLDELNPRYGFNLAKQPSGYGPSDHAAFYGAKVPVMHFFTGRHGDLHRPSDDFETLNLSGMRRIADLVTEVAVALANAEKRPEYVSVGRVETGIRGIAALIRKVAVALAPTNDGKRPFFGGVPDPSHTGPGVALRGVSEGGPAERAGVLAGDVIVRVGQSQIGNLDDFDRALRKRQSGDRVKVTVRRDGQERLLEVTLDPPR